MANNCVTVSYGLTNTEAAVAPASLTGGPEYGMYQTVVFQSATADFTLRLSDDQDAITITAAKLPYTYPAYSEILYLATATTATVDFIADIKTWTPIES